MIAAIVLDVIVLGAFIVLKIDTDPLIVAVAVGGIALIFAAEKLFLESRRSTDEAA